MTNIYENTVVILSLFFAVLSGPSMAYVELNVTQHSEGVLESGSDDSTSIVPTEHIATNTRSPQQLSQGVTNSEYTNVARSPETNKVFSVNKAVGVTISGVDSEGSWVDVTNEGVGDWNLTGWRLSNTQGDVFQFPSASLPQGATVKIIRGTGRSTRDVLYTNNMLPFWSSINDLLAIVDDNGRVTATYPYLTPGPAPSALSASNIPMGTSRKAKTIGDHGHKEPGDGKRDAQRTSTIQY
jgi:hypothetical protein